MRCAPLSALWPSFVLYPFLIPKLHSSGASLNSLLNASTVWTILLLYRDVENRDVGRVVALSEEPLAVAWTSNKGSWSDSPLANQAFHPSVVDEAVPFSRKLKHWLLLRLSIACHCIAQMRIQKHVAYPRSRLILVDHNSFMLSEMSNFQGYVLSLHLTLGYPENEFLVVFGIISVWCTFSTTAVNNAPLAIPRTTCHHLLFLIYFWIYPELLSHLMVFNITHPLHVVCLLIKMLLSPTFDVVGAVRCHQMTFFLIELSQKPSSLIWKDSAPIFPTTLVVVGTAMIGQLRSDLTHPRFAKTINPT